MSEEVNAGWVRLYVRAVMDELKDYVPAGGRVHFDMEVGVQMTKENEGVTPYVVPKKQDKDTHRIKFVAVMPKNKGGDGKA